MMEIAMSRPRKTLLSTLLIGASLSTASVFANTAKIYDTPYDGDFNGGEFRAETSANGTFYTFCLEKTVHVAFKTTYNYTISGRAFSGGPDLHDAAPGDKLSVGTAYLYEQFFKGTLVDSDGSGNYTDNHDFNAGLLQKAFWILEDESSDNGANYYVNLVKGLFGNVAAFNNVSGSKVKVMNLWEVNTGADVQSQLVYVPDGGMTAALLGLGVLSLAAFRRKK